MTPPTGLPLRSSTVAWAGIGRPAGEGGHSSLSTSSSTLAQPQEHLPTTRADGAWQRNSVTPGKSKARRLDSTWDSASVSGRPVRSGDICGGIAPRDPNICHDAFEQIIGLRAHYKVAVGEYVGRDSADHQVFGFGAAGVQVIAETIRRNRLRHTRHVHASTGGHLVKHVDVRDISTLIPVGSKQGVVHGIEATLLPGELCRL